MSADVVIVDPNLTVRRVMTEALEMCGLTVMGCASLEALVEAFDAPRVVEHDETPRRVLFVNLTHAPADVIELEGAIPTALRASAYVIVTTLKPDLIASFFPNAETPYDALLERPFTPGQMLEALQEVRIVEIPRALRRGVAGDAGRLETVMPFDFKRLQESTDLPVVAVLEDEDASTDLPVIPITPAEGGDEAAASSDEAAHDDADVSEDEALIEGPTIPAPPGATLLARSAASSDDEVEMPPDLDDDDESDDDLEYLDSQSNVLRHPEPSPAVLVTRETDLGVEQLEALSASIKEAEPLKVRARALEAAADDALADAPPEAPSEPPEASPESPEAPPEPSPEVPPAAPQTPPEIADVDAPSESRASSPRGDAASQDGDSPQALAEVDESAADAAIPDDDGDGAAGPTQTSDAAPADDAAPDGDADASARAADAPAESGEDAPSMSDDADASQVEDAAEVSHVARDGAAADDASTVSEPVEESAEEGEGEDEGEAPSDAGAAVEALVEAAHEPRTDPDLGSPSEVLRALDDADARAEEASAEERADEPPPQRHDDASMASSDADVIEELDEEDILEVSEEDIVEIPSSEPHDGGEFSSSVTYLQPVSDAFTLQGTVAVWPIRDVLAHMRRRVLSGTLRVESPHGGFIAYLIAGFVEWVEPTRDGLRRLLGQYFIGGGFIDEAILERLLNSPEKANHPLGELLVMHKYATADDIFEALVWQSMSYLWDLLQLVEARYTLNLAHPDDVDRMLGEHPRLQLEVSMVLFEFYRGCPEYLPPLQFIPGHLLWTNRGRVAQLASLEWLPHESWILTALMEPRTLDGLRELADEAGINPDLTAQTVALLAEFDLVTQAPREPHVA